MTLAEERARWVKMIRDDLLTVPALAVPDLAEMVEVTAILAARLCELSMSMRLHGCDAADARLQIGMTESLSRGLCLMGTRNVAHTAAEQILAQALATGAAALAAAPAAGTA